jgi:hypothetical protein
LDKVEVFLEIGYISPDRKSQSHKSHKIMGRLILIRLISPGSRTEVQAVLLLSYGNAVKQKTTQI